MGVLGLVIAADLTNQLLKYFVKTGALSQSTQDKPLLRELTANAKTFPGGNQTVSLPVQINFMADVAGFFQGYSEDDALTFTQGQNVLRAEYNWYEHHSGLEISWTELKKDGITILDSMEEREHSDAASVRTTTGVLKNRLQDFAESWARAKNRTLWLDGSQDPKAVPGVTAILTDTPTTGTTGGISRATYPLWRHRTKLGGSKITASASAQSLTKTMRSEFRQLRRYGGAKNLYAFCGSKFIEQFELEVHEKGVYTQTGWTGESQTNVKMARIRLDNVGFDYDPTLDDLAMSDRCFLLDMDHLKLRPMQNEENKVLHPERPYNVAVYLQSMTSTLALVCDMLNSQGIYQVA
jgi:hypothetical protein